MHKSVSFPSPALPATPRFEVAQSILYPSIAIRTCRMKTFTYAAVAALSALASAQTTTPAPTPGWWWDANGDGDSGPGPFGGRLDSSQQSAWESFTSANPSGWTRTDDAAFDSLTSALSITWATGRPSGFATKFGPGGPGWGFGDGNGGWAHGGGRGGPFGAGGVGGWGPDDGEWCSTGSWTAGPWTSW